ncbi:hypothetical protein B7R21_15625 [Subtercola boreus]|uniref:HTH araC/xylS-type domain-containing protein n=2 Tax=Subtercola boreus TaxID=120213 RepID=A0A3E0VD82_9MICO|nr:hypothetical protein B7R21_15625 [Subtercola boreus]
MIVNTGPGEFQYQGRRWIFGDVIVSRIEQSECLVAPRPVVDVSDSGYTSLFFIDKGRYSFLGGDRTHTFATGDAGWAPGWAHISCETHLPTRFLVISVQDRLLTGPGRRPSAPAGRIDSRSHLLRPTLSFLRTFTATPSPEPVSAGHPSKAVFVELAAALFAQTHTSHTEEMRVEGAYEAAVAIIQARYDDPALEPADIARQLNLSLRHLQRAFAANGHTIRETIQHTRLDAAIRAIPQNAHPLTLAALAKEAGMSPKELRHAARTTFGLTPGQLLRQTRTEPES